MIIDYSTERPPVPVLKAAGVTAVGRYIGYDSVPGFASIGKNLTRAEAGALEHAGIGIFLAFEYAPDAALNGHNQGIADGQLASRQLAELGAPADMTVYFAVDFDIIDYAPSSTSPAQKLGPAAEYFTGIHSTKPAYKVGVYGGFYAVSRCLDAGLASMAWQTIAWSGGQWDKRAVLRQELGTPLAGADFDKVRLHTASAGDFGQWPRPKAPKPPARPKVVTHVTAGTMSLAALAVQHGTTPMHILHLTSGHYGGFPAEVAAWGNAVWAGTVSATVVMPAGMHLRIPA